jgi:rsbT co-antagonist protein RsbR
VNIDHAAVDLVLRADPEDFIEQWLAEMSLSGSSATTARNDAKELLTALRTASGHGAIGAAFQDPVWEPVRRILSALSQSRAAQGATAGETSQFVLSLKKPLFSGLQR